VTAETPAAESPFDTTSAGRARHRRWDLVAAVGIGGALGTLLRYEIALAMPVATGGFPWATFSVNLVGALILGAITTLAIGRVPISRFVRPLAAIGFCGGLTTFSTWMVESVQLIDTHHLGTAITYIAATPFAGLLALFIGVVAARALAREGIPS
jgi:fluoride exporter